MLVDTPRGDARMSGEKVHRRVRKRKDIEKQWRKGEVRWQYSGDGEADANTLNRVLAAPRSFHLVNVEGEREALVVQTGGTHTLLHNGERVLRAKPRRSTTTENGNSTLVAIGDRVRYRADDEDLAVITHVYERASWLQRSSIRDAAYAQVLVANIQRILITAAASYELLRPGLIDRYIVASLMGGLEPVVVINKIDLPDEEDRAYVDEIAAMYREAGITVLLTSCFTGEGLDALTALTRDTVSAFSGHSGVGKTSLLNALIPDLHEKTAEMSEQSQRGVHTTTRSTLHALPGGGHIADTPGIREFGLHEFDPAEVHRYYPEFVRLAHDCRFPACTHTHEPDCAVKAAVDEERIHPLRYRNYVQMLGGG